MPIGNNKHQKIDDLSIGFLYNLAALSNSYPYDSMPKREAVCTIIKIVFGMT